MDDDSKSRRSKRVANAAAAAQQQTGGSSSSNPSSSSSGAAAAKKDKLAKKKKTTTVDFAKVEMLSLLRYERHFHLPVRLAAPKVELIYFVRKHFLHHPKLKDGQVIAAFLWKNKKHLKDIHKLKQT